MYTMSNITHNVPIRCQDVTVYCSLEQWKYLEGHKDLYMNVMMENDRPLTSLGGSSNRETFQARPSSPVGSQDCAEEDGGCQGENLNIVVVDVGEGDPRFKEEEEEIPIDTGTGVPKLQTCPMPLYSKVCTKKEDSDDEEETDDDDDETEDDEDDIPASLNVIIKSEVIEEETSVKIKEEEIPSEISPAAFRKDICPEHGTTKDSKQKNPPADRKPDKSSGCAAKSAAGQKFLPINRRAVVGDKPFSCADCGGLFKHKSSLVLHRRIHSGEKPYSCSECGKQFIQKANYIRHQRLHTGEKPYKCTECGKLYAQKQSLVMHQKFHAENEPFSCPECGENFMRQSHLVTHRKSHKGLRRYTCPDCGDFFMLRSSLVIHQKVHSAERPFSS